MRTRFQTPASHPVVTWTEHDDDTFNRTQAALHEALEELELPEGTLEDTVKIVRLPYDF